MSYKCIIFDLDGTLIDSMQLWRRVDEEFLNSRGIEVPTDLFDHLPQGNSFIQTAQYFKDRFDLADTVDSIMREWTNMVSWHYSNDVQLKQGAGELVKLIHKHGIPIGLGTSNSRELADRALTNNAIHHYFSAFVTGDMHLMGKPFPDIYLKCAEMLNMHPSECLVIEDTLTGVQAAKNAGMGVYAIYDADSHGHQEAISSIANGTFLDYASLRERVRTDFALNTQQ